ncbi:MAG: hypothetical protein MI974_00665 [Chitinophagales bacterium]|nr:hypothetical protein [Chitinophagales bacterium]
MTLESLLNEFYEKNGIPENGGVDKKTFAFKAFGLKFNMPNPKFRREVIYIHDIQHVLNNCDTSWKGEGFISGWEISTGMWKYFPLTLLSTWAMGYSLWLHPASVLKGFRKGLNDIGIIDLKISKSEFMKMELEELKRITKREQHTGMGFFQWCQFFFWVLVSQLVLLFPLIVLAIGIIWIVK